MAKPSNHQEDLEDEGMEQENIEENEQGDLGEEVPEGEGTGDPISCLISFKKIVTDILDENDLG